MARARVAILDASVRPLAAPAARPIGNTLFSPVPKNTGTLHTGGYVSDSQAPGGRRGAAARGTSYPFRQSFRSRPRRFPLLAGPPEASGRPHRCEAGSQDRWTETPPRASRGPPKPPFVSKCGGTGRQAKSRARVGKARRARALMCRTN